VLRRASMPAEPPLAPDVVAMPAEPAAEPAPAPRTDGGD
jgi:hypothetical protein